MEHLKLFQETLRTARKARTEVEDVRKRYVEAEKSVKQQLDDGTITTKGYDVEIARLAQERDAVISRAQAAVTKMAEDFAERMKSTATLDGGELDADLVKLVNSGIQMSATEWQELADRWAGNYTATRFLRDAYARNPVVERVNESGLLGADEEKKVEISFAQEPQEIADIYGSFNGIVARGVNTGTVPDTFNSQDVYWNAIAAESLGKIRGTDEAAVAEAFPYETHTARTNVW